MYWDINKTLSYNALLNFIIGNRGGGKSYGSKKFVINRFIKTGEQFIYVRRFDKELKKVKTFFSDVGQEFPEIKFDVGSGEFRINDEVCGYYLALSTAKIEKSNSFPNVTTLIFDEFILDKGVYHYLPDEVTNFLDMLETIFRSRNNWRALLLANAVTMMNPYFCYFKIQLPYGKNFYFKDDKLIELVANKEFIDMKKQTRFGKLINGTQYGDYSIDNNFLRDDNAFIEKKSGKCNYLMTLKYKKLDFGIWANWDKGRIYVSMDIDTHFNCVFAVTNEDMQPNLLLFKSMKNNGQYKLFLEAYRTGCLYYENLSIKNYITEVLQMTTM